MSFTKKTDSNVDDFIEFYTNTLRKITSEQRNIFITGDFNIDLLKCIENLDASKFSTANFMFGFESLINSATRITLNSATLIDNIFTNVNFQLHSGIFSNDTTDHLPIFTISDKKIPAKTSSPIYSRKITEEGTRLFKDKLCILDWSTVHNSQNATEAYDIFIEKLTSLYDEIFPLTETKKKKNIRKPWVTPFLLRCINKKQRLYKAFLRNRTSANEKI